LPGDNPEIEKDVLNCAMPQKTPINPPSLSATASADEILDKPETAERLKISTRTLDIWMHTGRVPFLKIGKTVRFRWSHVLEHLQQNCRGN